MNMPLDQRASAFPWQWGDYSSKGMTLRDYIATNALTGLLSHPSDTNIRDLPAIAYELADAMIEASEKGL